VLAGAALAPLVVPGAGQLHAQLSWVPRPDPRDLLATPGGVNGSAVVGGYLLGLATLGWGGGRPRGPLGGRWTRGVGLAVLLSPALLFVAAQATSIWVPRYLVFTVPLLCVLAGAALDALSTPAALAALLAIALLGAPDQLTLRHTHQTPGRPIDYAGAAAIIQAGAEPGDGLVLHPRDRVRLLDIGLAYHLRGHPRPRDVLVTRDQLATASLWATECTDPAACLTGVARVWLVRPGRYPADPLAGLRDAKARALSSYAVVDRWTVHGLTIALLRRGA
jgi:mannosyltransferase